MKRMLIDALHPEEMRVAIADNKQIFEFDFVSASRQQVKGNIYLAKITRVEPSLQAAFVEYGGGKQGFLPFSEIHPDYYQIPVSDRKKLMEEVERELAEEAAEEDELLGTADAAETSSESSEESEEGASFSEMEEAASAEGMAEALSKRAGAEQGEAAESAELTGSGRVKRERAETHAITSEIVDLPETPPAEAEEEKKLQMTGEIAVSIGAAHQTEREFPASAASNSETSQVENAVEQSAEEIEARQEHVENLSQEGDSAVETLSGEEEIAPRRSSNKKRVPFFKRYKIQEVVKRGQIVLVQVIKEERGNKGVSLTTYLSLAGRYSVLMPNSPRDGGVSRKISDIETRRRLKEVMAQLKLARGMSVIIRTAGIDRSKPEIRRDFDYLVKLWNRIREETLNSTAPALIYEENNLIKRAIRDQYTSDIEEVIVEGEAGFAEARDFMKMLLPSHTGRVKQYKENMPLFYAYSIEEQLLSMHDPMVKLKSGGYLIINPTEALISIDVNSGRSTGERNIEETALKTNTEAAHEVARQLRLRDLAGLIVIDFIDMMDSRNRRAVERNLKDALRSDRAKIQVGRISPFGLMEMSRQRLRPSIGETMHVTCPSCAGRGVIRSPESLSLHLMRTLEKEAVSGQWVELKLMVSEPLAMFLLNHKRKHITSIETRHGVNIVVQIQHGYAVSEFTIEKVRANKQRTERINKQNSRQDARVDVSTIQQDDLVEDAEFSEIETPGAEGDEDKNRRRRRNRGGRGRRGGRNRSERPFGNPGEQSQQDENSMAAGAVQDDQVQTPQDDAALNPAETAATGEAEAGEETKAGRDKPRNRGARGLRSRGRRRWKNDKEVGSDQDLAETFEKQVAKDEVAHTPHDLPQFTRQEAREKVDNVVDFRPSESAHSPETTSRPEGAPPRKGWWQQIIELD